MADETEITVTVEEAPEPEETASETDATASNAEAVVVAAETAVALAEGQAALAEMEAAAVIAEAAETVEEITAQENEQDRSIESLWQENQALRARMETLELTISEMKSSTLSPSPETVVIAGEVETVETTSLSTQTDTPDPTSEMQTEAIAESAAENPEPPARVKRVRWI